jgi:hypothetical protein
MLTSNISPRELVVRKLIKLKPQFADLLHELEKLNLDVLELSEGETVAILQDSLSSYIKLASGLVGIPRAVVMQKPRRTYGPEQVRVPLSKPVKPPKEPKPAVPYTGIRASELPNPLTEAEFMDYISSKREEYDGNSRLFNDEVATREWLKERHSILIIP